MFVQSKLFVVVEKDSQAPCSIFRNFETCKVKFLLKLHSCYVCPLLDYYCQLDFPRVLKSVQLVGKDLVYNCLSWSYADRTEHFCLKNTEET